MIMVYQVLGALYLAFVISACMHIRNIANGSHEDIGELDKETIDMIKQNVVLCYVLTLFFPVTYLIYKITEDKEE